MNRLNYLLLVIAALCAVSCGGLPAQRSQSAVQPERVAPDVPKIPERVLPLPPEHIMGKGQVPKEKLTGFLLRNNPLLDPEFAEDLIGYYIEEAAAEGVNYDTAFAQMCLETGYLSYGGLVTADMNNFCGLGAIGPGQNGEIFPDAQTGVRAHIQHLKAYASTEPLNGTLVDPRYRWVKYGTAPTIHGLAGTWAADLQYADKLSAILQRLYDFSFPR